MRTRIEHVKIIDGNGNVYENSSIIFDESGILGIGDDKIDAGRIIDGTGKTVLPGFIDCHVHPAKLSAEDPISVAQDTYHGVMELLKSGITTARCVGTKYNADVVLRDKIESGQNDGPRLKAAGEVICITCGHCYTLGMECDTVGETLKAARALCKKRVDWIKCMPTSGVIGVGPSTEVQLTREQVQAIVRVGKMFATPTCAHIMNHGALKMCVEEGITCVEHGYDMDEAIAREMIERGTWYVPTTVVTLMESTHIKPVNKYEEEMVQKAAKAQKQVREALKIAIKEGVKLAVGTDTGCPYTGPETDSYATELYLYSISGMKNMDVLNCATSQGAKLLGIDDITGSIEVGKEADIVVLNGDPVADIAACKEVAYTFCKGKLLYANIC